MKPAQRAAALAALTIALLAVPACATRGSATVTAAEARQSQTLERTDASTHTRTRTWSITTPPAAPGTAPSQVTAPKPGPSALAPAIPLAGRLLGLLTASTVAPLDFEDRRYPSRDEAKPRTPAKAAAPGGRGPALGPPIPPAAWPQGAEEDGAAAFAWGEALAGLPPLPPGTRLEFTDHEETVWGGNARTEADAWAKGAGLIGAAMEFAAKFKHTLAKFTLPGLPGANGASRGGTGGGGSGGVDLSAVGGKLGAGLLFYLLGAFFLLAAGGLWVFAQPWGRQYAKLAAGAGVGFIILGVFVDWPWTPVVLLVGAAVALGGWVIMERNRKRDDARFDAAMATVVEGVEAAPPEARKEVKAAILKRAKAKGKVDQVDRVVDSFKPEKTATV